jgi:hypothetical protein
MSRAFSLGVKRTVRSICENSQLSAPVQLLPMENPLELIALVTALLTCTGSAFTLANSAIQSRKRPDSAKQLASKQWDARRRRQEHFELEGEEDSWG